MNLKLLADHFFDERVDRRLTATGAALAARGAWEAGAGLFLTYPGSPVVETFEVLTAEKSPVKDRCRVVLNEHVAWHQAQGYSLAGGRVLVVMKHVGFHVAGDPAHYSGYLGARGGFVIVVGDDPGATCSTGEFDVRFQSLHTHLPILEPTDFGEALSLTRSAFELSEQLCLPVLVVLPAALCHGVGTAQTGPVLPPGTEMKFAKNPALTSVGGRAVALHEALLAKIESLRQEAPGPRIVAEYQPGNGSDLLIVPSIQRTAVLEYLRETGLEKQVSIWSPRRTYPLGVAVLEWILTEYQPQRILCLEPLEGFIEHQVAVALAHRQDPLGPQLHGKDYLPMAGETGVERLRGALDLFLNLPTVPLPAVVDVPPREGTFCPGCPHRSFFYLLRGVLRPDDVLGGDIGCSSLPPHHADWLTCMNSGASIASGVARAVDRNQQRVVSLIGDSTLFHSGLQTVLECAQTDSDQLLFILDNRWTAMTGHQPTPATPGGDDGRSARSQTVDIRQLLKSLGVQRIHSLDPRRIVQGRALLRRVLREEKGFHCVLVERECALQVERCRKRCHEEHHLHYAVVDERCRSCGECYAVLTCPAISADDEGIAQIDPSLCDRCGTCHAACPNGAIWKFSVNESRGPATLARIEATSQRAEAMISDAVPIGAEETSIPVHGALNLIITGLGGQGILYLSKLLRGVLAECHEQLSGWDNRGGAQRFGHVAAVIRAAENNLPLGLDIPAGRADAILALEATEALRFLHKAGPQTLVILDRFVLVPTNVRRTRGEYPTADEVAEAFRKRGCRVILADFRDVALAAGLDGRDANLLMLGRLLREGCPGLMLKDFYKQVPTDILQKVEQGMERC